MNSEPIVLPKRGRGRPKGAKNKKAVILQPKDEFKYKDIKTFTITVPKIPIWYKVRRMAMHVQNIEMHLKKDPLFISPTAYFNLLNELQKAYDELNEKGLNTHEQRKKARSGMDSKGVESVGVEAGSSRMGEKQPSSMGSGVPTSNPLGG